MTDVRATDTLANERTFLAYARTALAFIGFGFVIARFSLFTREFESVSHVTHASGPISSIFGTFMAVAGIACALYGAYRYVETARGLRANANRPMPDGTAIVIASIIGVIGAIVTGTLFAFR
jgi:putative membrane protein